jgi:SAM-dependent methyltransferase
VTGWFEPLYASAAAGDAVVPWDRGTPHPLLQAWADQVTLSGDGRSALVVGCGYGYDAELLAARGFAVTAFDVAPSAIEGARSRHPDSPVRYVTADLFDLPEDWIGRYEFVLESQTVQALPDPPRSAAITAVRSTLAPGGTLLVLAFARQDDGPEPDGPPWPLLRRDIDAFSDDDVRAVSVDLETDADGVARWRAVFSRDAG